ncbi:MAG: ABC transporter ATP-binding protein [Candidatus Thorarchaeota archaeon]
MAFHGPGGPRSLAAQREKRSRPVRVLLGRMMFYLGSFRRLVVIGASLSLIATVVSMFDPLILSWAVDSVLSTNATLGVLILLVVLYVVLKIVAWALDGINNWILADAQASFVRHIQLDVYEHLVRADMSYHRGEQSGNVTSRVTSDTVTLGTGIQVMIDFASQILMLATTLILLIVTSPLLALTSMVVVPAVVFIAVLFGTVGQRIMLASQRAYGNVSGQIAENLSGIHVAKAFNREHELAMELRELNQKAYRHGFKFMIMMSAMQPLMRATGQFGLAAVLFVGGTMAVGTQPLLTVGQLFLGIILVNRFMWPLLTISMMAAEVQSSLAAMDRVLDVLESKRTVGDRQDAVPLRDDSDGITFENVTFSYLKGVPVLNGVSFSVRPGETVAVVGHTGAGKTTLAALINRFYDVDEGRILIGDQDIRDVTLKSLHSAVSLVPQETYLFDGSIMENIRYGRPGASDSEIRDICALIGADTFIGALADGYDTRVIENGKNLSAGQKQMIAIARTMLANPRILILDEATSRLDAYSESLVQEAQARLFAGRTTIVIAHRLTTIANASRILVFDHGRLVEQGTHAELLSMNGKFRELYDTYYAHQGVEDLASDAAERAQRVLRASSRQHTVVPDSTRDTNREAATVEAAIPADTDAGFTSVPDDSHSGPARMQAGNSTLSSRERRVGDGQ